MTILMIMWVHLIKWKKFIYSLHKVLFLIITVESSLDFDKHTNIMLILIIVLLFETLNSELIEKNTCEQIVLKIISILYISLRLIIITNEIKLEIIFISI